MFTFQQRVVEKSGKTVCSMEYIESRSKQTQIDTKRDDPLGEYLRIKHCDAPEIEKEASEPTWKEIKEIVDKT